MKRLVEILVRCAAALVLVLAMAPVAHGSTPKVDPYTSCSPPAANFAVTISFDSTNNVPTVSATKNTNCVMAGKTVAFEIDPKANITSWNVQFPTTNPVFPGDCPFGTTTTGSSQSCVVVTNAAQGDYVYQVNVYIGGGTTKYTLDPRVIIRDSGKRKRHEHAKADSAAGL